MGPLSREVQVPYPCGSEMSPPALTRPSHFALSVFSESLIFASPPTENVPILGFFPPFFDHSGEGLASKSWLCCLLIPAGALQTWMQSCHTPARLSTSLPGLGLGVQEIQGSFYLGCF